MVGVVVVSYHLAGRNKLHVQCRVVHSQPVVQLLRNLVEDLHLFIEWQVLPGYLFYHNSLLYLVIISTCFCNSRLVWANESPLHQ